MLGHQSGQLVGAGMIIISDMLGNYTNNVVGLHHERGNLNSDSNTNSISLVVLIMRTYPSLPQHVAQ